MTSPAPRAMEASEPPLDLSHAISLLGLPGLPASRRELARAIAHGHPASRPWTRRHTAAYRCLWEALGGEELLDQPPLAS
ncbi:MAG: hypothetical protein VKI81_06315 [Synechococcaceae cyanobacterium]|nr:hypothetical protein [Synechococcaceae cyanobacterium]